MTNHQSKALKDATVDAVICEHDGCYVALINDETQIANHRRWHEMRDAAEHVKEAS